MRRLTRLTVLCVGVLLLAAPAAFACNEPGEMTLRCPITEITGSMGTSICYDSGQMLKDCCDVRSAPEAMQALSIDSAKLLTGLEVTDLHVVGVWVRAG